MSTFNVGDRVKVVNSRCTYNGWFGTITESFEDSIFVRFVTNTGGDCGGHSASSFELVESAKGNGSAAGPGTTHKPNQETASMSALEIVKSAKLTQEERVLRTNLSGYELEDSQGNVTSYGKDFMNQKMWEENRSAYAKELIAAKKTLANEVKAFGKATAADEDDE